MLYLDTCALVKHYIAEPGTDSLNARMEAEEKNGRALFTSVLTFAEVQRVLAQKLKNKALLRTEFDQAKQSFEADWAFGLTMIELGANVLLFIPSVVETTNLKSSDAIQLASALWLRDLFRLSSKHGPKGSQVVFATSDMALEQAAAAHNFATFNPETTPFP